MFRLPRHLIINQVIRLKDPVRHNAFILRARLAGCKRENLEEVRLELLVRVGDDDAGQIRRQEPLLGCREPGALIAAVAELADAKGPRRAQLGRWIGYLAAGT